MRLCARFGDIEQDNNEFKAVFTSPPTDKIAQNYSKEIKHPMGKFVYAFLAV